MILVAVVFIAVAVIAFTAMFGPLYYALFRVQRDEMRRLPSDRRRALVRNEVLLIVPLVLAVAVMIVLLTTRRTLCFLALALRSGRRRRPVEVRFGDGTSPRSRRPPRSTHRCRTP